MSDAAPGLAPTASGCAGATGVAQQVATAPSPESVASPSPGDVGLAFGLVIAAGCATCVGAALAFVTGLHNTKLLAGALGASAGVMLYVSFVEIFSEKAVAGFEEAGYGENEAYRYATLMFFGGMGFTWALGWASQGLMALAGACAGRGRRRKEVAADPSTRGGDVWLSVGAGAEPPASGEATPRAASCTSTPALHPHPQQQLQAPADGREHPHLPMAVCVCDAGAALEALARMSKPAAAGAGPAGAAGAEATSTCAEPAGAGPGCHAASHEAAGAQAEAAGPAPAAVEGPGAAGVGAGSAPHHHDHHSHHALARMGLLSALAIGLHNLPEGLATFVGTLADPSAGIAIAVAITLHNIPEGIAVALPIYFATGSKLKGFLWSAVAGLAEPIAGLLGWLILRGRDSDPLMYGCMFSIVAGMMVYIALVELLPAALRYDPGDTWVSRCAVAGMAVMAASLMLFKM
ncbi:hypothetical protein HYH03_018775 [Edaphochlamys debaryana]|uniref:Zinc transporter n=1 Tax=Edaphochlamys debaryana TaxID=47281 RepID=A0A836BMT1_9CHLO|nr:hypothetical protein HYH03_018775 [Edaphochlamys debaryana]|eukprot:KAG2482290.1 hypothetical protein HYH03_018775 [Edaphochlamys debaryana]